MKLHVQSKRAIFPLYYVFIWGQRGGSLMEVMENLWKAIPHPKTLVPPPRRVDPSDLLKLSQICVFVPWDPLRCRPLAGLANFNLLTSAWLLLFGLVPSVKERWTHPLPSQESPCRNKPSCASLPVAFSVAQSDDTAPTALRCSPRRRHNL